MFHPNDDDRYVQHLQSGLCPPDWEGFFETRNWSEWREKNAYKLRKAASLQGDQEGSFTREMERRYREFTPATAFELPDTHAIFQPLLNDVKRTAESTGLKPVREIRIVTSTDISATPLARPTSGVHLLFVGPGTWSFCNYWAKAFTSVVKTIARERISERIQSSDDLKARLRIDPTGIVLCARLALHYAVAGTTLGFGEVEQPPENYGYRTELLRAMETFAVAHEYAHFVAEERLPELSGIELETFCDRLAVGIARNCPYPLDGWLGFAGIGPLLLFRSVQLCEIVRDLLIAAESSLVTHRAANASEHPPLEDRLSAVKAQLIGTTAEDQRVEVQEFYEEYDRISAGIVDFVKDALISAVSDADKAEISDKGPVVEGDLT